jgi:hypothetical protein
MKTLFTVLVLSLSILVSTASFAAEHEKKKVCEITKDAKTGKSKQVCKTVTIHKKLEVK